MASKSRVDVTVRRARFGNDGSNDLTRLCGVSAFHTVCRERQLLVRRCADSQHYMYCYGDGAMFVIDRERSEILADWPPGLTADDVATYVVGPICGLLLYLQGSTCLHASAIAYRGKALAFVGGAEAGKSTLVAQFARLGYRVLTDDILRLRQSEDGVDVLPSFPRIGLWPKSVAHLWGKEDALPKQVPTWGKRYFDLAAMNLYQDTGLPLAAVYVLTDREDGVLPAIEPLCGRHSVLTLIANKYVTRVSETEQDSRDFLLLSELAGSVPIRRVRRADALSDLRATCEEIVADYARLARATD